MTTGGGGGNGMDYGDDYIAGRISLELDSGTVPALRELNTEIERFHTAMEAAIRSDMTGYLDRMADAAKNAAEMQANLTQQLSVFMSMQGHQGGAAPGIHGAGVPPGPLPNAGLPTASGGFPGMYPGQNYQPYAGATPQGMPGMNPGMMAMMGGARPPSSSDVAYQLNGPGGTTAQAAQYLNMQHPRGAVSAQDVINISPQSIQSLASQIADRERAVAHQAKASAGPSARPSAQAGTSDPYRTAQSKIQGVTGLAGQVMNELGSSEGGHWGQMAQRALNWGRSKLQQRADASGGGETGSPGQGQAGEGGNNEDPGDKGTGGLSGVAKGLGIAGGVVGALTGGFALVEKAGAMEQGWRNIASPRGGGAAQGFELSMRARQLAMDPNISSAQSRQIYQAMVSEGYANSSGGGPGADQYLDFFKTGIKQFSLSVDQLTQELRLGRVGHQQVVSAQTIQAYNYQMQQQAKNNQQGPSQQDLQRQFLEYVQSAEAQGASPAAAMADAAQRNAMYANVPAMAGTEPGPGGVSGATEMIWGGVGPQAGLVGGDDYKRWAMATGQDVQMDETAFKTWALKFKVMAHDTSDGKDDTNKNWIHASGMFAKHFQKAFPSPEDAYTKYNQYAHPGSVLDKDGKPVTDDPKKAVQQAEDERKQDTAGDRAIHGVGGSNFWQGGSPMTYHNNVTDRILQAYNNDPSQIEVLDENGKPQKFDLRNKDQQTKLADGTYKWRHTGTNGKGMTEADTPQDPSAINKNYKGGASGSSTQVSGMLTIKIDRNGNVTAPASVPLTPNDRAANSGTGTAQKNNPPPGDGPVQYQSTRNMWG